MNFFEMAVGNTSAGEVKSKSGTFQTVDTKIDATKVNLYQPSMKTLGEIANLPNNTTDKSIKAAEVKKNTLGARNYKLAALAKHRMGILRETARGVDIQMQYQSAVMDTNLQIEATTAKYGIKAAQYNMTKESLEGGYKSYMDELKGGSDETTAVLNGW